jgi:hypothetical protein
MNHEKIIKSIIETKKKIEENSKDRNYIVEAEIRFGKISPHVFKNIITDSEEFNTTEKLYEIKNKKNIVLKKIQKIDNFSNILTNSENEPNSETNFSLKEEISSEYIAFNPNTKAKIVLSIERNYHNVNNKIYLLTRHKSRTSKKMPGFRIDKTIIINEDKKITYELELEITDNNINIENFIKSVKEIQKINEEYISIKQLITTITPNINLDTYKFKKPIDVNIRDIRYNFQKGGSIGYKLDGTRKFIAIINKNIYSISTLGNENIIHKNNNTIITMKEKNKLSLYDSEEVGNQYHIFDTIIHLGKNVTEENLIKRISYIPKLCININKETKKQLFLVKPHFIFRDFNGFKETHNLVLKKMEDLKCDGIIYTPLDGYFNTVFKWKPIKTFDFALVEGTLKLFNKGNLVDSNFVLQETEKELSKEPHIIECYIENPDQEKNKGKAFYIRPRPDKKFPNTYEMFKKTSKHVGEETKIINSFRGKGVYFLRSYHNDIKRELLKKGSGNLLDIGTGKGGDIYKWGNYKKIFCIEPDEENINELINRSETRTIKTQEIIIIKTKIENLLKNFPEITKENISTISAMFSLTLVDLGKLTDIIDKISSKNCLFICTVMSKKYVKKYFETIEKSKFTSEPYTMSLRKNNLTIHIKDTIVKNQTETLVDTKIFIQNMNKINFKLKEKKRMIEETFMSDNEYILSSMYESLIFYKEEIK